MKNQDSYKYTLYINIIIQGYNIPRQTSKSGGQLPSPRVISNNVLSGDAETPADDKRNLMLFTFGQFIDHDLTFTPIAIGERIITFKLYLNHRGDFYLVSSSS